MEDAGDSTIGGLLQVVLPLRAPRSGPKLSSSICTSLDVLGQFSSPFQSNNLILSTELGHSMMICNSLAHRACSHSW